MSLNSASLHELQLGCRPVPQISTQPSDLIRLCLSKERTLLPSLLAEPSKMVFRINLPLKCWEVAWYPLHRDGPGTRTPFLTGQMFPAIPGDLPGGLDRLCSTSIHQEGWCQVNSSTEVFSVSPWAGRNCLILVAGKVEQPYLSLGINGHSPFSGHTD